MLDVGQTSLQLLHLDNYFIADINSGHFLSHFRQDSTEHIQRNINSTIRKLKVDFEYVIFLIKNLTKYCSSY